MDIILNMAKIPMKREKLYPEQASVKLSGDAGKKMRELRSRGVDVGELRRLAVTRAIDEAYQEIIAS